MLVGIRAWFPVAKLVASLWIPAPASARVTFFRGNDGVDVYGGICRSRFALGLRRTCPLPIPPPPRQSVARAQAAGESAQEHRRAFD